MSMTKKIIFISSLVWLVFTDFNANAQHYILATGFRKLWDHGFYTGGSIKFIASSKRHHNDAAEIIVSNLYKGVLITGLYLRQVPIFLKSGGGVGVYFYYGAGAHVGNFKVHIKYGCLDRLDKFDRLTKLGVDGVAGIEFELNQISRHTNFPLIASLDFKPYFDLYGAGCGGNWMMSFSIAVILMR